MFWSAFEQAGSSLTLFADRSTNNTVAAFYATNNAGAPGPWVQISTNVNITMDTTADYSLTGDSGSDTVSATAVFDNLTEGHRSAVDGRAKFLDCPPPGDDQLKEFVDTILNAQGEPQEKRHTLDHRGSVDVAYSIPGQARSR